MRTVRPYSPVDELPWLRAGMPADPPAPGTKDCGRALVEAETIAFYRRRRYSTAALMLLGRRPIADAERA